MTKMSMFEKCVSKLDKLDKLDSIETNVTKLVSKISDIETRLNSNEKATTELQTSVTFLSAKYDEFCAQSKTDSVKLTDCTSIIQSLKSENDELRKVLTDMQEVNKSLKDDLIDLKCRSMRDNLVFTNIPEDFQNHDGRRFKDTEEVLNKFLNEKLQINDVKFERVHRVPDTGRRAGNRPRTIVAKFSMFKERESVRRSGYKLKGTNIGIHEQFPEEIEAKRRELYPLMRKCRQENKKTVLVRDKLYVDGVQVRPEDAARLHGDRTTARR